MLHELGHGKQDEEGRFEKFEKIKGEKEELEKKLENEYDTLSQQEIKEIEEKIAELEKKMDKELDQIEKENLEKHEKPVVQEMNETGKDDEVGEGERDDYKDVDKTVPVDDVTDTEESDSDCSGSLLLILILLLLTIFHSAIHYIKKRKI